MPEDIHGLRIYTIACEISDEIWQIIDTWKPFAKSSMGSQIVRSADSIGANIAEGYGRYHYKEDIVFLYYARGSAKETLFWLERAAARKLLTAGQADVLIAKINSLIPQLNGYIRSLRVKSSTARINK